MPRGGYKGDGYGKNAQPIANLGKAANALRRGGRDLAELTGDPDDATSRPTESAAQRKLRRRLGL